MRSSPHDENLIYLSWDLMDDATEQRVIGIKLNTQDNPNAASATGSAVNAALNSPLAMVMTDSQLRHVSLSN
ncbi:MAG: hypothetical protein K0U72_12195 [Gammaproteobacteria bacterium]|nr:hypothetical protein [Gammaproteobacteria bacterium]